MGLAQWGCLHGYEGFHRKRANQAGRADGQRVATSVTNLQGISRSLRGFTVLRNSRI